MPMMTVWIMHWWTEFVTDPFFSPLFWWQYDLIWDYLFWPFLLYFSNHMALNNIMMNTLFTCNVLILVFWYIVCIWHFDMCHAIVIFYAPVINTSSLRRFFFRLDLLLWTFLWFQWLVTYIEIRPHCNNWIESLNTKVYRV